MMVWGVPLPYWGSVEMVGEGITDYYPDVWSNAYWQKAVLRAYLVCSNGVDENWDRYATDPVVQGGEIVLPGRFSPADHPGGNGVGEPSTKWGKHDPADQRADAHLPGCEHPGKGGVRGRDGRLLWR